MDIFTKKKRSEIMSKIRAIDTNPELRVRKALHKMGYRFRLHDATLPGKPDIVLPKYKAVVQVRGCFWHSHTCKNGHVPKSRKAYWSPKLAGNKRRDRKNDKLLRELGWRVITVWECRSSSQKKLHSEIRRIARLLNSDGANTS